MPIKEALFYATQVLKESLCPSPELDAEVLLAHILKKDRTYILAHGEEVLSGKQERSYHAFIQKRAQRIPVAQLTEHKEFYGLDIAVSKDVLIPRPETETLIDIVCEYLQDFKSPCEIIDVGTGSGAISLALASKTPSSTHITALDSSDKALVIAQKNIYRLNYSKRISLIKSNLLSSLSRPSTPNPKPCVIVANLPYLSPRDYVEALADCPEIGFEPKGALVSGDTGLELIEKLLSQVEKNIFTPRALFLEIGERQGVDVLELSKKYLPKGSAVIKKDLSGRDRFCIITF